MCVPDDTSIDAGAPLAKRLEKGTAYIFAFKCLNPLASTLRKASFPLFPLFSISDGPSISMQADTARDAFSPQLRTSSVRAVRLLLGR